MSIRTQILGLPTSLVSVFSRLRGAPKEGVHSRSCWADENPIRADLFGLERMRTHAHSLAVSHARIGFGTRGRPLIARLNDNARVLQGANIVLSHASEQGKQLTPAAEWLIDNYYLMDMQIQTIKVELPVGYYRDLPKLVDGVFADLPRVFEIAWALVAHTDSHISTETIREFLETYQQTQPLLIRELWAVPINIRIVLIENLRRISQKISADLKARERADTLVDALTENGGVNGPQTMQLLAGVEIHTLSRAFLVQFAHRLRGHDPQKDPAFLWLDGVLQEKGTDLETLVHEEMQEQGALNATIRNVINSIRLMTTTDWNDLVEDVSFVSRILAAHGEFAGMDLTTRHLYCRAVEKLAKGSRFSECDIASLAVSQAQNARVEQPAEPRCADPGYYLIAEGRPALEQELGFRAPLRVQVGKISRQLGIYRLQYCRYASDTAAAGRVFVAHERLSAGTGILAFARSWIHPGIRCSGFRNEPFPDVGYYGLRTSGAGTQTGYSGGVENDGRGADPSDAQAGCRGNG